MNGPRIGGLFEGYGGLTMAIRQVLGGELAWYSENNPAASKVLAHHEPDVPNLGDITAIDWAAVAPVDILAGGWPCQPFSAAGRREGENDPRHLWPYAADAIGALRPKFFVGENVRGHLTLGFDQVVRDLDLLHYEVHWVVLRAADVGAPHGRARLFVLGRDRARQLRSRADRRRGVHRDQPHQGGRHVCDQSGCCHGREGISDLCGTATDLRRPAGPHEARDGAERREDQVGCGGRRSQRLPGTGGPVSAAEAGAGSDLPGVAPADSAEQVTEGEVPLERGTSPACQDREVADPRAECTRAGGAGTHSAFCRSDGGASVGRVVGTRRGPLRASQVPWAVAGVRPDGGRAHLRAADVGAPHGRYRIFITAVPSVARAAVGGAESPAHAHGLGPVRAGSARGRWSGPADHSESVPDTASVGHGNTGPTRVGGVPAAAVAGGEREAAADADRGGQPRNAERDSTAVGEEGDDQPGLDPVGRVLDWGQFEPAIRRWEALLGRLAPEPTVPGRRTGRVLNPVFVEWLMGLPEGHVTAVPGLSRNDMLKILGNGVVPQQAKAALLWLLPAIAEERAA